MAELPSEIRIGTRVYKLEFVKDLKAADDPNEDLDGECSDGTYIRINSNNLDLVIKSTLLHEIIHAIGYYIGDDALIDSESRVTSLANILYDLLITNPEVLNFLFDR
jgi:hypothetical protein